MTVFVIYGKPHISAPNGYQRISDYEYYMMLEQNEVDRVEVIEYD